MTKGKKGKKANNTQQNTASDTNKKDEDVEKQIQNSSEVSDKNSNKSEISETNLITTTVNNVLKNQEISVESKVSEAKKESLIENKSQENTIESEKKENVEKKNQSVVSHKEKVKNEQTVQEQKSEEVQKTPIQQIQKDQNLEKENSQGPPLYNPEKETTSNLHNNNNTDQTRDEASTNEKNKEKVKIEQNKKSGTSEENTQNEIKQEVEVDKTKLEFSTKKKEETSDGGIVNTTELQNKDDIKSVEPNEKTNERKRKEKKNNDNLKGKTESVHKFKNDDKKKQDSNSKNIEKPSQSNTWSQQTNKISGYEFREHMNGQNVTELFDNSQSSNEKFKIICDKYSELYSDFKVLHLLAKKQEKQIELMQNEKEILEVEAAKQSSSREKLEHLCRELQKQNRAIREDNLQIIRDEEEKRKTIALKFEKTFKEISTKVQESNDKTNNLRDDNLDLTVKFRDLLIECDRKDQELFDYREKCTEMLKIEESLRNQISMYTEKYEGFQHTLSRSNEIFAGFKSEMEVMSKKINNLESETATWKQRWENSHKAYLDVLNQKTNSETELLSTSRQLAALLKLCRTLQSERAALLSKLNATGANITPEIDETTTQEAIEDTLRQIAKNVPDSLKSPPAEQAKVGSTTSEKDKTTKHTETKEPESSKPSNKKSNAKK